MLRATADTNVIVSGLIYRRGKLYELLQQAIAGEISLTVSAAIVDEMAEVLLRNFDATVEEVAEAREILGQAARTVRPAVQLSIIKDDPAHDKILECAASAGSDYIITGDSHLLRLKQYAGIRIVNVSDFLEALKLSPATEV